MTRSFADVARMYETAGRFALAALLYSRAARECYGDGTHDSSVLRAAALDCLARTTHPVSSLDFGEAA